MERRISIQLSYDGTAYCGWQRQPNAMSVQQQIEDNLSKVLSRETTIVGCGRTDAGVHATNYIAHSDILDTSLDLGSLRYKLNKMLPRDISIERIQEVADDFHARFDARSRKYEYRLHGSKNPFLRHFSTRYNFFADLDRNLLDECAAIVLKTSDFESFCKAHTDNKTNLCDIYESRWESSKNKNELMYTIKANRFLRGMVRLIVGASLNVSIGKLPITELKRHIEQGTRTPLMQSAPALGLSLVEIEY